MAALIDDVWLQIFHKLSLEDQLACACTCKRFEYLLVAHTWKLKFRWFDTKRSFTELDKCTYKRLFGLNAVSVETLLIGNFEIYDYLAASPNQFCFSVASTISFFLGHSLPNLCCLHIASKFMNDEMSALIVSNCSALKELKVTGSSINGAIIRQMTNLERLYVPDSEFTGREVSNLLLDLSLTELDVSFSMVGTNILEHVGAQNLKMVGLSAFALDADLAECVLSMSNLKTLTLKFPETGSTDLDFMDYEKWPKIFESIGVYVEELSLLDKPNFLLLQPVLIYMPTVKIFNLDATGVVPSLPSIPKFESILECHLYNGAKGNDITQCLKHFEQLNHLYVHDITPWLMEELSEVYQELMSQLQDELRTETVTIHFLGPYDRLTSFMFKQNIWKQPAENDTFKQWEGLKFEFGNLEDMMQNAMLMDTFLRLEFN